MEILKNFNNVINKSNSGIILCDNKKICRKLCYDDVWNLSKEIQTVLYESIEEKHVCVGLFFEQCIYLPSVILSLHCLDHTFAFLKESNFEKLTTDLQIKWILSYKNYQTYSSYSVLKTLTLSSGDVIFLWKNHNLDAKETNFSFKDIFCVIQTSGSTGENKVVRVQNKCIEDNVLSLKDTFKITFRDIIFWGTPLTFDPSLVELLLAFCTKANLLIVPKNVLANPIFLYDALFKIGAVTFLQMVPSVFFRWTASQICDILEHSNLKILALGGEKFPKKILNFNRKQNLRLFNLYGVTELSCWATIHEIQTENGENEIPLGREIGDTVVIVKDEFGKKVTNGQGEIFLGSSSRICLINTECIDETINTSSLISTGDLVEINENGIFYIGRKNSVVKRFGHKVDLSFIETTILTETGLENKCVFSERFSKILTFILSENPKELSKAFKTRMLDKIRVKLLHSVSSENIPDFFDVLTKFPLTSHGKIDVKTLEQYYVSSLQNKSDHKPVSQFFLELWCKYFGISFAKSDELKSYTFFEMGGNSILATQLLTEFKEDYSITECPKELVTLLFEGSLENCLKFLEGSKDFKKRKKSSPGSDFQAKKLNKGIFKPIKVYWKYDLKACVDSPPVVFEKNNEVFTAIGSFSHVFAVLKTDGSEFVKIILPGVVENQAAISPCKNYALIGCFNGTMYCIDFSKKEIEWQFLTGDKIKSTACFCGENSDKVVFGSYDKHVYCVSLKDGQLIWKTPLNGSVASNPLYFGSKKQIFMATLKGFFYCVSEDNGSILWYSNCDVPIFGSPCMFSEVQSGENCLVWPDVQGKLYCFTSNGQKKWDTQISGYIFSSLVLYNNRKIYFGSQDNYLYELDVNGNFLNKILLNSQISSTPFIYINEKNQNCEQNVILITACNAGYLYVVSLEKFEIFKTFKMPGEVFSSPFVFRNKVYVGCRDNFLYCLDL